MMRILIIHNLLWAHYKASVFQALQQLVDQQPDVTLKVLQIARNERSRADLETLPDADTPSYSYTYDLLFDRFLEDISLRERGRVLLRHVKAYKPDVIMLTGYYDLAQLLVLGWAKTKGVRVIMQNESTLADSRQGGWKEHLKRRIFGRCDGFFCFGTQSANYLLQLGVRPEKILLRKNAVDNDTLYSVYERALPTRKIEQQKLGLKPNNFVFVGRLIAFKNLQTLMSAFAEAQKKSLNAHNWGLLLLGDGSEKDLLLQQIEELGIAGTVRLLPGRPWFEVPNVLALSDVLVLPSWSEPWGLVVNEALACGLPVVVSDRCGCAIDLVQEGENGYVFDPSKTTQLTELLIRFIDNTVNRTKMSQLAQQSIAAYSPKAVAEEMLNGFLKVGKRK